MGEKYLFPYPKMRDVQNELIEDIADAVSSGKNIIVHAPTGLGKTAATLGPALKYAIDNKKTIFFLTSRHTQHVIAIETLQEIKKKFELDFVAIDLIGKKWMCPVPGTDVLYSNEFTEYCKQQREEEKCEYYTNTKEGFNLTTEAKLTLENLKKEICHIERFSELCGESKLCAYELATTLAKKAKVIVADYYYIFNPHIRELFFGKAQLDLANCIVIVDEGHNLPERIRKLQTMSITNNTLKSAIKEAKKINDDKIIGYVVKIQDILNEYSSDMKRGDEKLVSKNDFIAKVAKIKDYDEMMEEIEFDASIVREKEKKSSLGVLSEFLNAWTGPDKGYVRIISQRQTNRGDIVMLSYRCLDPSEVAGTAIEASYSTIIMSGTLTPLTMYRDLLGFDKDVTMKRYPSPFPEKNRLSMVVPLTTTKFSARSDAQYKRMGEILADMTNKVKGNSAIFFPSYYLRNEVYKTFVDLSTKTAFLEDKDMIKEEKSEFLEKFKSYNKIGAVLLGAVSGSFGEGIDLPGDLLKCVIVVGLPLQQPTLETKKLIDYYDLKFGKGWDYGYVAPALTKCLQSAGRCIRSETDRGIIIFLDERYVWNNYFKHFPADWDIKITKDYGTAITKFYREEESI